MVSIGNNIKSTTEQLQKVQIRQIFDIIRKPRPETASLIEQLRIVRNLNPSGYAGLKQRLPFFVCALFNPPYRKNENFAYTEYFLIDIDHIAEKGIVLQDLRQKISADPRTVMYFVSPGGDGLKVMFKLSERCYDAGLYKTFYKIFATKYSQNFNIEQVIDTKTCDVARACFLSADPNVFFNPSAETITLSDYINPDEDILVAFDLKNKIEKEEKQKTAENKSKEQKIVDPGNEIMEKIRSTLNPAAAQKSNKVPAYVPEILNNIMDDLKQYIEDKGICVANVENIQYGKKMKFRIGLKKAEINLFYGKRGFSVIQSPRTGTDKEANELMAEVINGFLAENGL